MPDEPAPLTDEAWAAVSSDGGELREPPVRPVVTGSGGWLPSRFAVEDAAVACVGAALTAAADLRRQGGADTTEIGLDRDHVAAAVTSERHFRHRGRPAGAAFAPLSRFWATADGWVRTHANYPWHRDALLTVLGVRPQPDAVAGALARLPAEVVEERVVAAGGVAAAVRTAETWRGSPQGRAVAGEPLVGHEVVGDAPPRPRGAAGGLPAAGVRVLDLTRVIAGPVCTRVLGALGASVLRLDPPGHPDLERGAVADTLLGKRSALLDLAAREGAGTLDHLLARADVVVCGYRPGALDRFGLAPGELARRHPGLVVVVLVAWGHTGPWAGRRGFDSVVQAATGVAMGEAPEGTTPGALPCQLLDHGTGYLAAAAALDGLRRQRQAGGTHVRRLSLARSAHWLTSAPAPTPGPAGGVATWPAAPPGPWTVELESVDGRVEAVAPPGTVDGIPLRWPVPVTGYGSDVPVWPAT